MTIWTCPETGTACERMCLTMCHIISEDRVALHAAVEAYEADAVAYRAEVERLRGIVQADLEEKAEAWGEVDQLRLNMLKCGCHHPGYIIGMHWMAAAYSRICAGDTEAEVMADYGYARTSPSPGTTQENGND